MPTFKIPVTWTMQGELEITADSLQDAMDSVDAGEPQLPGSEEGPASLEQIAQILIAAVQAGEIDEQTAEAVMQELAASEGVPAEGEAVPPDAGVPPEAAMGAEALPAEAPEAAKTASALFQELVTNKK